MGNLIFNNISTEDLGLVIQAPPTYTFSSKDTSTQHVPGRNGDILIDNYSYNNVDRTYSIASVFRPGTEFIANSQKIIEWLMSAKGYCRLEDSYDPLVFRMAEYHANGSLTDYYGKATSISITFDCKPQRFLKGGEKAIDYSSAEVTIENPTKEIALPYITISGITYSENDVVMLSVENTDTSEVVSNITISKMPKESITIDSEEQTVFNKDSNGIIEDLNKYINLNGSEFPKFLAGYNTVAVAKYIQKATLIENYNNLIKRAQIICAAKYQPYDAIVESRQKKYDVKSYNNLKLLKEESYTCDPYITYCASKAETYTFESYNTLLQTYGKQCAFIGSDSTLPEWLGITHNSDGTFSIHLNSVDVTKLSNTLYGGFIMTGSDKRISFITAGKEINNKKYKESELVNITFYQAKAGANGKPEMLIDYTDIPNWLSAEISYNNNDIDGRSPDKIKYSTTKSGYYYTEKSGIFGKSKWNLCKEESPMELAEVSWSTWKKAFISSSGLSTSTTTQFPYKYLSEIPQYEDITVEKTDSDGNTVEEVTSKVHFKIEPASLDLSEISFKATDDGYYRANDQKVSEFIYLKTGDSLGILSTTKSDKTINVYYLKGIPNYSSDSGYPDWLQPELILIASESGNEINPKSIDFKVNKEAYYSYSYKTSSGELKRTDWMKKSIGDAIGVIPPDARDDSNSGIVHDPKDSYSIYMIESLPESFTYTDSNGNIIKNIGFYDKDDNVYSNNQPPSWVKVSLKKGAKDDGSEDQIRFEAAKSGYYKWDAGLVWLQLEAGKEIVSSSLKDDTTIYYMDKLPSYLPLDNVFMKISESTTGNPETVSVISKKDGYYKANTETDWTYRHANDTIAEAKVSEDVNVYYLDKSNETLPNIKITIIPRWWML